MGKIPKSWDDGGGPTIAGGCVSMAKSKKCRRALVSTGTENMKDVYQEETEWKLRVPGVKGNEMRRGTIPNHPRQRIHRTVLPEKVCQEPVETQAATQSLQDIDDIAGQTLGSMPKSEVIIETETILKEAQKLSLNSYSDKQLYIEMKNMFGTCFVEEHVLDKYEEMVQNVLFDWRKWSVMSKLRTSILAYKCNICSIGWWFLHPFQEHIRIHEEVSLRLDTYSNECCIVADRGQWFESTRLCKIEGCCPKCLTNFESHASVGRGDYSIVKGAKVDKYYNCQGCGTRFSTCWQLFRHEGECGRFGDIVYRDMIRTESMWKCDICATICLTQKRYELHNKLEHSVRSDWPTVNYSYLRRCRDCNAWFHVCTLHVCPQRGSNARCKHCCRRFQHKVLADLHLRLNGREHYCPVCNMYLRRQCMNMEHLLKHSKNFLLVYKCCACLDNVLFSTKSLANRHCAKWHSKPSTKRCPHLPMLVPRSVMFGTWVEGVSIRDMVEGKSVQRSPNDDERSVYPTEKPSTEPAYPDSLTKLIQRNVEMNQSNIDLRNKMLQRACFNVQSSEQVDTWSNFEALQQADDEVLAAVEGLKSEAYDNNEDERIKQDNKNDADEIIKLHNENDADEIIKQENDDADDDDIAEIQNSVDALLLSKSYVNIKDEIEIHEPVWDQIVIEDSDDGIEESVSQAGSSQDSIYQIQDLQDSVNFSIVEQELGSEKQNVETNNVTSKNKTNHIGIKTEVAIKQELENNDEIDEETDDTRQEDEACLQELSKVFQASKDAGVLKLTGISLAEEVTIKEEPLDEDKMKQLLGKSDQRFPNDDERSVYPTEKPSTEPAYPDSLTKFIQRNVEMNQRSIDLRNKMLQRACFNAQSSKQVDTWSNFEALQQADDEVLAAVEGLKSEANDNNEDERMKQDNDNDADEIIKQENDDAEDDDIAETQNSVDALLLSKSYVNIKDEIEIHEPVWDQIVIEDSDDGIEESVSQAESSQDSICQIQDSQDSVNFSIVEKELGSEKQNVETNNVTSKNKTNHVGINTEVAIKQELENNDEIDEETDDTRKEHEACLQELSKVFQASKDAKVMKLTGIRLAEEVTIKEEPLDEDDYEDDIIMFSDDKKMNFNVTVTAEDLKKEYGEEASTSEVSKDNSETSSQISIDLESKRQVRDKKERFKKVLTDVAEVYPIYDKRIYRCKKCKFVGVHKEFAQHKTTVCKRKKQERRRKHPINIWPKMVCTKCDTNFKNLKSYFFHFTKHGFKRGRCPKCSKEFQYLNEAVCHLTLHIKRSFINLQLLKASGYVSSKTSGLYQCKVCQDKVEFKKFFVHWENHLDLVLRAEDEEIEDKDLVIDVEMENNEEEEQNQDGTQPQYHQLPPDKMKQLLDQITYPMAGNNKKYSKKCVLCRRLFSRCNEVKRHVIEHLLRDAHSRGNWLLCQLCGQQHNNDDAYRIHMRNHAAMSVYKCEICNRSFSDSSNFAKHKKVHNVHVLSTCDLCKKKFHSKMRLEKHMEMHASTEPIPCPHCNCIFYTESTYKTHQRSKHEKKASVPKCKICLMKFTRLNLLWDHMWEVHKERKQKADCPICMKQFRKHLDVIQHIRAKHDDSAFRRRPYKNPKVPVGSPRLPVKNKSVRVESTPV